LALEGIEVGTTLWRRCDYSLLKPPKSWEKGGVATIDGKKKNRAPIQSGLSSSTRKKAAWLLLGEKKEKEGERGKFPTAAVRYKEGAGERVRH